MVRMSQRAIARARDDFFRDGTIHPSIRSEILLSWRRSAQLGISPSSESTPAFVSPQRSASLRRAAEPVVQRLLQDVGEKSAAMLLLNTDGIVVGRWSTSSRINRTLDASGIEPGRVFDEGAAGTTGLGTPLENGRAAIVEGAEHVLAALDSLTAAGTPIIHPVRGSIEGVIDIVGVVGVDTTMMLPLIGRAARDIGERLIAGYAAEDRELLDAFLTIERRGPKRPVLAMNDRLLIGNSAGNELGLAPGHLDLWERSRGAIQRNAHSITVRLSTGRELIGKVDPVGHADLVGVIMHLDGRSTPATSNVERSSARPVQSETVFDELERGAIIDALERSAGNKSVAAQALGISRATLYRMMARLGIRH